MGSRSVGTIGQMFSTKMAVSKIPKVWAQPAPSTVIALLAPLPLPSAALTLIGLPPPPDSILGRGTHSPTRKHLLVTVAG